MNEIRTTQAQPSPGAPSAATSLGRALRYRWWLVALVLVPCAALSVAYTSSLPPRFTAVSVVALVPDNDEVNLDLVDITTSRQAVSLTSTPRLQAVADQTGLSVDELQSGVTVETTSGSANLQITATTDDEQTSIAVADVVAAEALDLGTDVQQLTTVSVAPAVTRGASLLSSPWLLFAILLLASLALATWVAFVVERLRPRVRVDVDAEEAAGVPFLTQVAAVPAARLGDLTSQPRSQTEGRSLRFALTLLVPEVPRQLAVLGVGDSRGTASAAFLLAQSLAVRERVLLIDADVTEAMLTHGLPDVARASLAGALDQGGLPEPPIGPGLVLLARDGDAAVGTAGGTAGGATEEQQAQALSELLLEQSGWDAVIVAAPAYDGDGLLRQAPVSTRDALLVVPRGARVDAVRGAARLATRLHEQLRGVVLARSARRR